LWAIPRQGKDEKDLPRLSQTQWLSWYALVFSETISRTSGGNRRKLSCLVGWSGEADRSDYRSDMRGLVDFGYLSSWACRWLPEKLWSISRSSLLPTWSDVPQYSQI
jgi:hypothetical protein